MNNWNLQKYIQDSLVEDIAQGDITSEACISDTSRSRAKLLIKDDGVLSGVAFAKSVFHQVDPSMVFTPYLKDGDLIKYGQIAFEIEGKTRDLLKTERLVLNVMQRMSGISTLSYRYASELQGLSTKILDTRKTTPLNRYIEKWAVRIGGCYNYRNGLYDRYMIKDNHIEACGSISKSIKAVLKHQEETNRKAYEITIEVKNLVELEEVLNIGKINRIMFDNFEIPLLKEAILMTKKRFETEASGGVNLETLRQIALTGVDFISVGALTHSAGSLDLSLKIHR
ncbi:MAG: carboxylating nicotinate-nucleotide diphosphorylase [Saprospiraceae bacterium]|uniref:Probable nicotinate-nucleotide pyrophosphorylase [carboxylating] n=1 Tax=Candidatus Defluviibacterium haderslevense TaxID=2981993 RepID=A0A9D7SBX8_9BACT|nr:carboxylating nicotinate-nucleotide diphosphorylase [Candidatus Defluviibacterium haderslevense]